ncbi:MAG: lyase [Gemmatimonadetes bacterium]|nr:lyase [Gemmatimonadota bacterium]
MIRTRAFALVLAGLVAPAAISAQSTLIAPPMQDYVVPWGREGRPRDPSVSPVDGAIFFVGQAGEAPSGNYVARIDPKTGEFRKYQLAPGTNPHTCLVDSKGMVWYTGNRNGTLGKIDPKTGEITVYKLTDSTVRDPHTMVFDKDGNVWFTAQQTNAIGFFNVKTEQFRIVKPPLPQGARSTNPYGIVLDSKGRPWFNLFNTNMIGTIDPVTFELKTYPLASDSTRNRRIAITSDDKVYYTDYRRGRLGMLDPATGKVTDWALPGGAASLPYGMIIDDQNRVWVAETGSQPNKLVGFDPKSGRFFSNTIIPGERNTVRHMFFDPKTKQFWFGNDAGTITKVNVSSIKLAM